MHPGYTVSCIPRQILYRHSWELAHTSCLPFSQTWQVKLLVTGRARLERSVLSILGQPCQNVFLSHLPSNTLLELYQISQTSSSGLG